MGSLPRISIPINFIYYVSYISEGYAPFASMAPRTTFLDVPDTVILAPGPGHYYPEMVARERAKGGSSIANMVCH